MLCCCCHFDCLFGTDKAVSVADRLRVQLCLHGQALQAQSCLLHNSALLTVAHGLLLHLQLAVEEDLLLLVLDHEARLADRVAVVALLIRLLLVALLIGGFRVRLAVEDHLLPRLEPLEDVQDVLVLRVVRLAWAHEGPILQAIVLELSLIFLSDAESLQAALVLQFKAGLGCAILDEAEDLN